MADYTNDQIDSMLKAKADSDCTYNVCEINYLIKNRVSLDSFNQLKEATEGYQLTFKGWIDDEALARSNADKKINADVDALTVRVKSLEDQTGSGQNTVVSVSSVSDLSGLTTYNNRSAYVINIGMYVYNDTSKSWSRDFITENQIINVSTQDDLKNLLIWNNRTVLVKDDGIYRYSITTGTWNKDQSQTTAITFLSSESDLNNLAKTDGNTAYVNNIGMFTYSSSDSAWKIKTSYDGNAFKSYLTISDLKKIIPNDLTKHVKIQKYFDVSDNRSGGTFYYDAADTTTVDDGVFVFTSNVLPGRWKRVLNETKINILQGGLLGLSDEGDLLNKLLKACENQSTVLNYTRKFTVDGLEMRINTSKQINLNMTLVDLTDIDIDSSIPTQDKYNIDTGCALLVYGQDAWTNNPTTYRRRGREKLKGVFVSNVGTGTNVLGMYLKPDVTGQFDSSCFDQCFVTGFDYNLILSSNCYLMAFYNCKFNGAKKSILTTSSYLGIESSMQNMGENIRFIDCNLSDSNKVLTLDYQMWLNCYGCSFDYVGKSTDTTGWFELLGQVTLNLTDCHYESGNQNSQLGKKMFYTNNKFSAVNIKGGTMVFGSSNDNDYVFYSDEPLNHNFTIEGVWVFGAGLAKKAWSNTGMGRFRIATNTGFDMQDVNAFGVQAPNKTLTRDYNFIKSNLLQKPVDQWYVSDGGDTTRTSSISSSGVTGSYTTTTDENGNTVPCLKLVVNKTEQSVSLLIKRPILRNSYNPAFRMRFKSNIDVPGNLYASIVPVDVSQEIDISKSIFTPTVNMSRWNASQFGFNVEYSSNSNVQEMRCHQGAVRTFEGLETFDYYRFNFNFTLRTGFELYILSAECYDMDN